MNQNITLNIIDANPDKHWEWSCISYNPLNYKKRYLDLAKKYLSAFRIQSHFRKAIYDPEYKLCRDIIERHYEEDYSCN